MSNTTSIMSDVQIAEFRKLQENVQTPGPKCRNCFYDIIWDKDYAQKLFGKNRPFEMSKPTTHTCPRDEHDQYIMRHGYGLINEKVTWMGGPTQNPPAGQSQLSTGSPPPSQQQQQQFATAIGSSDISAQIAGLTNSINQLTDEYQKVAAKQNEDIIRLRTIVDEYIRHNPLESSFLELTRRMMSYLPEAELGPKRADEIYKTEFESTE